MEGLLFQPAYKPTYSPGRVSQMLVENPGLLGPRQRTTGRLRFMIRWGDRFLMLPVPLSPLRPPPVCTFFLLTVCLTSLEFILCICVCVCVCVVSHVRLFVILWTVAHQVPPSWDSPGKNTGMGCHFQPRDWTQVSCISGRCFNLWVTSDTILLCSME